MKNSAATAPQKSSQRTIQAKKDSGSKRGQSASQQQTLGTKKRAPLQNIRNSFTVNTANMNSQRYSGNAYSNLAASSHAQ